MRSLEVQLAERSYPIHVGPGLLQDATLWRQLMPGRQVLVISDDNVARHYLQRVRAGLDGLDHASFVLPPGEGEKTLARFGEAIDALASLRASRDACVIALGGGVIGDLAGFAAACWMRGIAFVQMPTTLLAMVDSSVGGKTAIDLPQGKNLVGAFHQPRAVIADTDTLATLPDRELRAGLAEVVKYGAIFDAGFLDWLDDHADTLLARDADALAEAILRSCRYKADVVARDETEQGERALLNFGHTFGHALETAGGYERFRHGEAVALGMVIAARLSAQLGRAPAADAQRLSDLLARFGLPVEIPAGFDPAYLLQLMRLDKKSLSGRLRLILWRHAGAAEIVSGVEDADILNALTG
ncbi:MAG: 3-dehydroquinate synthase [Lysobacterales bacterium]